MVDLLKEVISTSYPKIYDHLVDTFEMEVVDMFLILFQSQIISIFISDLNEVAPKIADHIFDCFLLEGEIVIYTLIIKFFEHSQDEILGFDDETELTEFMKKDLP